jgi:TolB-like protein
MPQGRLDAVYEFGGFRLLAGQRRLTRADGTVIELTPRALDALHFLVQHPGELLDKSALIAAVWPNVVVEENNLNQVVSALRRALGDGTGGHRFIVTVPGRGYQFVAPVRVNPADMPTEAALSTQGAPRRSIAVLPFVNMTGDAAKEYFSDGMAEELIHILARIPGLKVPSRTSSFSYKGRNVDVRDIARDLDVSTVLEGSVRSAGERIRVTAQLIDGSTGFHLWSENYDRHFGDVFELQDELARAIMNNLRLTLDRSMPATAPHGPPTRDIEAYHLYLRAMAISAVSHLPDALRLLEQALDRDASFARARSALANLRSMALVLDVPLGRTLADTEQDVLRSLDQDGHSGPTHAALAVIYAAQGRWLPAKQHFDSAIASDGDDPLIYQSYGLHLLGSTGFLRQYLDAALAAHRLAPGWVVNNMNVAVAHALVGEAETARQYAELCNELGAPQGMAPLCDALCQLALRAKRFDEAADIIIAGLPAQMGDSKGIDAVRRLFAALSSGTQTVSAVKALDAVRGRLEPDAWSQIMKRRFMLWYTQLGALDQSFAVASESLDHFARSGTIGTAWAFLWMAEMLPFRQDERFQALCRRMAFFDLWQQRGPPDHCELKGGRLLCH